MNDERQAAARPEQPGQGGFEEGHRTRPDSERIGQFSDGNEQLPDDEHVGQFSDGNEQLPDDTRQGKVQRQRGRRALTRPFTPAIDSRGHARAMVFRSCAAGRTVQAGGHPSGVWLTQGLAAAG